MALVIGGRRPSRGRQGKGNGPPANPPPPVHDGAQGGAGNGGNQDGPAHDHETYVARIEKHAGASQPTSIPDFYSSMNAEELTAKINQLHEAWTALPEDPQELHQKLVSNFHLSEPLTVQEVEKNSKLFLSQVISLYRNCLRCDLLGSRNEASIGLTKKMLMVKRAVTIGSHNLKTSAALKDSVLESFAGKGESFLGFSFERMTEQDLTPFQHLIQHLLFQASLCSYRKLGDALYVETHTENGLGTHFWKEEMSIKQFVLAKTNKDIHWEEWKMRTGSGHQDMLNGLTEYLRVGDDAELPELDRDRFWTSWNNGMYHIESNEFFPYGDDRIPPDVVSHKYFDQPFDIETISEVMNTPGCTPMDLPTPAFDRLLATQGLTVDSPYEDKDGFRWWKHPSNGSYLLGKEIKRPKKGGQGEIEVLWSFRMENGAPSERLLYESPEDAERDGWTLKTNANPLRILLAMMGRMMYPLYKDKDFKIHYDNWQKIIYILGPAGNGKSTVGNIIRSWYNPKDVGILASNCEEMWALSGIYTKLIWMCYEVRSNFRLDTASFQSMVSGESTAINKKHCDPFDMIWNSTGALFGNEMPARWHDGGGSLIRRILLFIFAKVPTKMDPNLFKEIEAEMPVLMYKCNSMYRMLNRKCAAKSMTIDDLLGPYFRNTRNHLMNGMHTLFRYLSEADELEFSPTAYCRLADLQNGYRQFCQDTGIHRKAWNEELYEKPFRQKGLTILKDKLEWPPGSGKVAMSTYVVGVTKKDMGPSNESEMSELFIGSKKRKIESNEPDEFDD